MALQAGDIADLVTTTLRELGRLKWTDLATSIQEYIAMPQLLKKNKISFDSGYGIQWNVMVSTAGTARDVGLFQTDNLNIADGMKTCNIPWRHTTCNWSFEEREVAMNREPARIVELVKTRRAGAMIDLAELMETDFWGKPTSSSDTVKPYGIDYWLVHNATEGFNGGLPSGFTDVAGLDPTAYTRWKNWSAQYTNISRDDLVTKWRKAATFTQFKPPVDLTQYASDSKYGYYTNYSIIGPLETLLEDQNDNLGNDIASKDGQVLFRRIPVTWVPKLEANTRNPIYGINWGTFSPVFLKGWYMKESGPETAPNQHTVQSVHVDTTYNWRCVDRRKNFELAAA